jgi:hypothetical protein
VICRKFGAYGAIGAASLSAMPVDYAKSLAAASPNWGIVFTQQGSLLTGLNVPPEEQDSIPTFCP